MPAPALKVVEAAPAPALAPTIAEKIEAAQSALAVLQGQVGDLALDKEFGKQGAAARLDKLNQQITDAERHLAQLHAAHEAAAQRDNQANRAAVRLIREKSLADFETALAGRTEAAKALADAIAQATAAYHRFVSVQNSLSLLLPLGVSPNDSDGGPLPELIPSRLVEREFYRVGARPNGSGIAVVQMALPGARSHDLMHVNDPGALPTLVGEVAASTARTLSKVRDAVAALA